MEWWERVRVVRHCWGVGNDHVNEGIRRSIADYDLMCWAHSDVLIREGVELDYPLFVIHCDELTNNEDVLLFRKRLNGFDSLIFF